MTEMDKLLGRVKYIAKLTGSKDENKDYKGEDEEVDAFTLLKRQINDEVREVRQDIKNRNEEADAHDAASRKPEIVKQTTAIRGRIKDLRNKSQQLRDMVDREAKELKSKGKESSGLDTRRKMCDLIDAHIDECERWSKGHSFVSVRDDPSKRALLKGADFNDNANPPLVTFTPDPTQTELEEIDGIDEWRMQIQANEKEIDEKLDLLVEGTSRVVHLANMLGEEYRILGTMVDDVDKQMDKTSSNLDDANKKVKETLEKVGGGGNCCLDIFLVVAIVACLWFIIQRYVL